MTKKGPEAYPPEEVADGTQNPGSQSVRIELPAVQAVDSTTTPTRKFIPAPGILYDADENTDHGAMGVPRPETENRRNTPGRQATNPLRVLPSSYGAPSASSAMLFSTLQTVVQSLPESPDVTIQAPADLSLAARLLVNSRKIAAALIGAFSLGVAVTGVTHLAINHHAQTIQKLDARQDQRAIEFAKQEAAKTDETAPQTATVALGSLLVNHGTRFVLPDSHSDTVYARILQTQVDPQDPRIAPNPALFAASVNRDVVQATFPEPRSWRAIMTDLKDDPKTYQRMRDHMETWGGFVAVEDAVNAANVSRIADGGAPILLPSEMFEAIETDPVFGNGGEKVALTVIEHMATDPKLAKDPEVIEARLADTKAKVSGLMASAQVSKPAPFHYDREAGATHAFGAIEKAEVTDVPTAQFARADSSHASADSGHASVEPLAHRLSQMSGFLRGSGNALCSTARGENRKLLPYVLDFMGDRVDELAGRIDTLSPDGQEVGLLEIKQLFFEQLSRLKKGNGSFYSEYLRKFSQKFLSMLSDMLPPRLGVANTVERTRKELFATLPEGMFKTA